MTHGRTCGLASGTCGLASGTCGEARAAVGTHTVSCAQHRCNSDATVQKQCNIAQQQCMDNAKALVQQGCNSGATVVQQRVQQRCNSVSATACNSGASRPYARTRRAAPYPWVKGLCSAREGRAKARTWRGGGAGLAHGGGGARPAHGQWSQAGVGVGGWRGGGGADARARTLGRQTTAWLVAAERIDWLISHQFAADFASIC